MLPFSCPPSLTAYERRRLNTAINHTIESMHIRSCSYPPPAILRDIFRVLFQTVCSTCHVCQSGNLSTGFSVWTFPQLPWTKLLSKYKNELTRAQPFLSQLRLPVIIKTIVKYSNWEHSEKKMLCLLCTSKICIMYLYGINLGTFLALRRLLFLPLHWLAGRQLHPPIIEGDPCTDLIVAVAGHHWLLGGVEHQHLQPQHHRSPQLSQGLPSPQPHHQRCPQLGEGPLKPLRHQRVK